MKAYIFYVTLCSFTQAVYISRMTPISRMTTINRVRSPTAFRPGINLQSIHYMQRPWNYGSMRLTPAASHRTPYVVYRSSPQRYAIKHYAPSATRNLFSHIPWKTTVRLPPSMSPVTPEYEFIKAASAQPVAQSDGGTGAIHTIPAPNLSLSEKPIVVIESSEKPVSDQPKPSYEVTEKYTEGEFNVAKIESPIGFSKATSFSTPELQTLLRNGAALQLASEYSLPGISQHEILPQQFQMQTIASFPSHRDLNTGSEGIFIPPNALYQSDPMFLQKLQSQLMQRYPAVEFVRYVAETATQAQLPLQPQASQHNPQIVLLENEQLNIKPLTINDSEQKEQKNVVQRDIQEASVVTLIPHSFVAPNTTQKQVDGTTTQLPQNVNTELVAAESQPVTTTIKYVIETDVIDTENQNTTPIYYAQDGHSVGSVIANGFYSAINDVRAAAALAQVDDKTDKPLEKSDEDITTTTSASESKTYIVKSEEKSDNVITAMKPLLGVPFTKATNAVNISYTLVRADEKQPKVTQEGTVYAGQIVEATVSEDHDFNKEKATFMSRRAPIRLIAVEDSDNTPSTAKTVSIPKVTALKAKISPKTKLTFDDKTGEPILRIYASYLDNASQKDALISKLTSLKPINENEIKKDLVESWRGGTVKSVDKTQEVDANHVTQFGLKIRERSDDYIPLFDDYDD